MWCWRRMEKISWADHVRNEEVLIRVNEKRNILHEIRKRKANWIGHILHRNCLVKQTIEGKIKGQIEVTRRRGRRCKKLLDDLQDRRGYCQLKEEALERTMWRNHFGRGFGPVIWQITDDDDVSHVTGNPIFLFKHTNSEISASNSWKCTCLGLVSSTFVHFFLDTMQLFDFSCAINCH